MHILMMTINDDKQQLRAQLRKKRAALTAKERCNMSQQIIQRLTKIASFNQAKSIFCYLSYQSEVDTISLIDTLIAKDVLLAVPKITGKTTMIAVPLTTRAQLRRDSLGILTPLSNQQLSTAFDIAIIPGLGFTTTGGRLGYGRGYYDRWLAKVSVTTKIAITFEQQIINTLPMEKTDMLIDIIVTEKRIITIQ